MTEAKVDRGGSARAMLSRKAKYALKALVELAREAPGQLTSVEIAARTGTPRKFLEAILAELTRAELIVARRGKGGGYVLIKPPEAISFADIIRIADGPLALAPCVSQMAFRPCPDCVDMERCTLRPVLQQARDATAAALEQYSLARAIERPPEVPAALGDQT